MPQPRHYNFSFKTPIRRVLKQVHPSLGINAKALEMVNLLLHYVFDKLMNAVELLIQNKRTITSREIQHAVRLVFPGELGKYGVSTGSKAVVAFNKAEYNWEKGSRTKKSGLVFPPSTAENMIRRYRRDNQRVGAGAPVYLAAVLEFITAEILELAGNVTRDNKRARITNKDIFYAIMTDEELEALFKDASISGVVPFIHKKLLPKKNKK